MLTQRVVDLLDLFPLISLTLSHICLLFMTYRCLAKMVRCKSIPTCFLWSTDITYLAILVHTIRFKHCINTPCPLSTGATKFIALTSSNLNRFSKFFYHWKEKEISNKTCVISHHTLTMLPHYLWEFKSSNLL